jgi:molecular chaperone GrpE
MSKDKETKPNAESDTSSNDLLVENSFSKSVMDYEGPTHNGTESEAPPQTEEEKLRAKVAELEDRLLRSMAELENFRKRSARQMEEVSRNANDRIIGDLLDVVSNLDRALQHCNEGSDIAALRQGMEMIHGQFMGLLTRYDIRPIEAVGKSFDPKLHEALMQIDSAEYAADVVAAEISKGFVQGERVLRHTQVAVSRGLAAGSNKKNDN